MTNAIRFLSALRNVIAMSLCWVLVLLTCTPFAVSRASTLRRKTDAAPPQSTGPHREGELLVRFRSGVPQAVKDTLMANHGVSRKAQLRGESGIERFKVPANRDVKTAALELSLNPQVEFAEPNFLIAKDDLTPNDPQFANQWALRNTGQDAGQYGSDISAAGAWQQLPAHRRP